MSPTPSTSPTPGDRTGRPDPSGPADHAGHDHSVASDCDDAIAELYAFLDGELDDAVMIQVETHRRRCSPCLEAFDFEADLRRVIAAKCTEHVSAEAKARLCVVIRELSIQGVVTGAADAADVAGAAPGVPSPADGS